MSQYDVALVGGGLQNGLIALALRAHRPDARIALIERAAAPGGNHTWCFQPATAPAWVAPLVAHRWDAYDVAFPRRKRTLAEPYACVTAERLAHEVAAALDRPGSRLVLHATAEDIAADRVVVRHADGTHETIAADRVVDARGPDRVAPTGCGWQKFVGQELVLAEPHGLARPVIMNALVPQRDGFRFFYVLPLAPDRLLVEDTYFSDGSFLDVEGIRGEIAAYAIVQGWTVREIAREETGVLPMPWEVARPVIANPLVGGYAGGWFHPVTGYSFPIAMRLAEAIATGADLHALAAEHAQQLGFAARLTKMMFRWFAPDQRHHVLEHFYRLPEPTIRRFYDLELTSLDRARIFAGRPPRGLSWRAVFGMEAR